MKFPFFSWNIQTEEWKMAKYILIKAMKKDMWGEF